MTTVASWLFIIGGLVTLRMFVETLGKGIDDPYGTPRSDSESPGVDRCCGCGERILVENTYQGMCDECLWDSGVHLPITLSPEDEWDVEAEWSELQRILDDESREGEDHR